MTEPQLHPSDAGVAERRSRERRLWTRALLISALLHAIVFLLWRHEPLLVSPFAAAGPDAGDDRAAAGSLQAMNVRTPASRPIVPPPLPLPTITDLEIEEFAEEIRLEDPGLEGGIEAPLPGLEGGAGAGDAGNAAEGLNRLQPPQPRSVVMAPTHDALRGKTVEVWVFVQENGRVEPDSTTLRPPTSDRNLNRRLLAEAADWLFEPAQKDGRPVAAWYFYTFSM